MAGNHIHWVLTVGDLGRVRPANESGTLFSDGPILNWVEGVVQCQHVGLVRAGVRVKVAHQTDLRVRWPHEKRRQFVSGQRVVATIPAAAVRLEAGMFRRSRQRWNRWIGRIVLVESRIDGLVYTVKIHGEDWTLKGYGPVMGARTPPQTWDVVNVVVDPQKVELSVIDNTQESPRH